MRALLSTTAGRVLAGLVALLAVATVFGLVALWPNGSSDGKFTTGQPSKTLKADVVGVAAIECQTPNATDCRRITIKITSGGRRGRRASFTLGDAGPAPSVEVGDDIRVIANQQPAQELPAGVTPPPPYSFVDFERRPPLLWLTLLFAAVVLLAGRWRGALSLLGLGLSLLIVVLFIVPAILDGRAPVVVAIVGSMAVMLLTIALAHGLGAKSIAAILGTTASLVLTVALAVLFTRLAHVTGFSSEEATFLQVRDTSLSLEGLVLAGIIIAALGVLDDVTVSQASTVMALRRADPAQRFRSLYRSAIDVGRDHVTATVNTLVLAYVGASLPIVLIFSSGNTPFSEAVNFEVVAENIVATLVGSIGLIAAVPITTAVAALLATRLTPDQLADEHEHAHHH